MKKYELMLLLNPEMKDQDREELMAEFKNELATLEISITKEDVWGVKDLAYKINNSTKGYYVLFELESEGKKFPLVSKYVSIKKDIWRELLTKIED